MYRMQITEQERQTLVEMVDDVAGSDVRKVAILLMDQPEDVELTDEIIAEDLQIKLDEVRKSLYRLSDLNIASFRRTRDAESGWFIYFWKINPKKIIEVVITRQRRVLWKLMERLQYERENMFFTCDTPTCTRKTFQEAMELDFVCNACDRRLVDLDTREIVNILDLKIAEIEAILENH